MSAWEKWGAHKDVCSQCDAVIKKGGTDTMELCRVGRRLYSKVPLETIAGRLAELGIIRKKESSN